MKTAPRKYFTLITAFTLLLAICSYADAHDDLDDRYDDEPVSERFKLRIGGFLIGSFNTTARLDSTRYPLGTLIDLEEDFNVDSSETVLRIDGFYRFNKKHRIDWTYYGSRRSGTAVASQEYVIGDPNDPDGGFIIPRGSRVQTKWDFDLLKVGYAWSFLNKRRYEMFIGTGLNIRRLDIEIDYQAAISTFGQEDRLDTDGTIPLPTFAIGGRWHLSEKWQSIFRYELFLLKVGGFRGSQQDFQLLLEHSTFKYVGFGVGINTVDINIRASNDTLRGEIDSRIIGLLGYTKIYF